MALKTSSGSLLIDLLSETSAEETIKALSQPTSKPICPGAPRKKRHIGEVGYVDVYVREDGKIEVLPSRDFSVKS